MSAPTPERPVSIARLIAACARNRGLTLLAVAAAFAWGVYALARTPLDAIPDLSDVQVIVFTEWPGQSPDLVEDQVTYPISAALLVGAARALRARPVDVRACRSSTSIFEDGTDLYWARSRVLEYLTRRGRGCPTGVTPTLGPDATGVGWVYEYALVDTQRPARPRRAAQPPGLEPALRARERAGRRRGRLGRRLRQAVPGQRRPEQAARRSGSRCSDVVARGPRLQPGGRRQRARDRGHEHVIRGRGYVRDARRTSSCVPLRVGASGAPVCVRDVAEVALGPGAAPRPRRARRRGRGGRRHRRHALRRERARA